jgi:DnaK suppressor protein
MRQKHDQLSVRDRNALRATLESMRAKLLRACDRDLETGTHPEEENYADPSDAATRGTEELDLLSMADHDRERLAAIDHALARMADGTYGKSERSGRPIPLARLRAAPWATLTADEEQDVEAESAPEPRAGL